MDDYEKSDLNYRELETPIQLSHKEEKMKRSRPCQYISNYFLFMLDACSTINLRLKSDQLITFTRHMNDFIKYTHIILDSEIN